MIRDHDVLLYPQAMVDSSLTACKWQLHRWQWHETLSCITEWILVTDRMT